MKKWIVTLVVVVFTVPAFSQPGRDANEVWPRVEALNKAVFETKDSAAITDLVAEGVSYGHSSGKVEDKPTMLRNAVANDEVYKNITVERLSTGFAGKTVIVRYILRADAIKAGTTSSLNIGILQVWAKDKGKWQLYARQAVKVNPK